MVPDNRADEIYLPQYLITLPTLATSLAYNTEGLRSQIMSSQEQLETTRTHQATVAQELANAHGSISPARAKRGHNHKKSGLGERILCLVDIAGVFASTLCMVHCILLPLVLALLPVIAKPLMANDYLHVGLAGFVLSFCLMAYLPGYFKHKDKRLLYIGALGLSLVFFATFQAHELGEIGEIGILTVGNILIVFGHLLNRKLLSHVGCKHD